jgi:hypothetical protein
MESDWIEAYLKAMPAKPGFVGVVLADGSPLTLPVWYRFDGASVSIWTTMARRWPRAARRTGRASFAVGDSTKPFAAAVLRGDVEIREGDEPELFAEACAISERYLPDEDVEAYVRQWWPDLQAIVRIRPDILRGWDRGY